MKSELKGNERVYTFFPYKLDAASQRLLLRQRSGKEQRIHLPPKAFSVLQYLIENTGRLITHTELLEKVWPDTFVQPEVLASHIRDIRAALGDDAKTPKFIETLPRRGYRFIAHIDDGEITEVGSVEFARDRLVGRETEFSKLHQCYRAAMAGRRQLVFVTGEPGMGKTTLCRAFLRQSWSTEIPYTTWGQCIEGYGVQEPYSPLLKAIGELCRVERASIIPIFKTKAPTCIVQFSDLLSREERIDLQSDVMSATSGRMLREVLDALEEVAESRPLIMVLDDLQWVDRATVDVISEFARRHQPARILLIGTFRPFEAFLNDNPITVLKEELLAHRLCTEISLSGLTEPDIHDYLGEITLENSSKGGLSQLLYRRSEGNPLFLVATLEHCIEQGLLTRQHGELRLTVPLDQIDLDIPRSLRRIIESQIDHLDAKERQILEVGSIEGPLFSPKVIASATEFTCDEVEDICHRLASRSHIIRSMKDQHLGSGVIHPYYQFVHVLYRDVLYDRQSPGRRSGRHKMIGSQLEDIHEKKLEQVAAEVALHFEHAPDWKRAVRYWQLAAGNSERLYVHSAAIAQLSRALELVVRIPDEQKSKVEIEILERLAAIYVASLDSQSVGAYERLFMAASASGFSETAARALLSLASCLLLEHAEHCLKTVERAAQVIATLEDPVTRERMEMTCHVLAVCAGGWDTYKIERIRQIFHRIRQQLDAITLAPHMIDYGMIQWASSKYEDSHDCLTGGLRALVNSMDGQNPYLSLAYQKGQFYFIQSLFFNGEWGKALNELDRSIETAGKNGDSFHTRVFRLSRAWFHFHAMDFNEAIAASELMGNVEEIFGGRYLIQLSRLVSGSAHVTAGNYKRGLELLEKAQGEMRSYTIVYDWCFRLPLHAALVQLWLSMEDLKRARAEARDYLELAFTTEDRTYQALSLEVSARIAVAEGKPDNAIEFISRAIQLIKEHHVPLAAWHVHATANLVYTRLGDQALAEKHGTSARKAVWHLADSLGPGHSLREHFLSSSSVSRILEGTN